MAIVAAASRGGRRQRAAAHRALIAVDVPVNDSSALADALTELWAYGPMSATMRQGLVSKAVQDGLSQSLLVHCLRLELRGVSEAIAITICCAT